MGIKTPPNLNPKEIKCFNEIVKPQLEELYSYTYDKFEFKHVKIFMAKDKFPNNIKKPDIEKIKAFLNKIPNEHLTFDLNIYFVSYNCRDDNHKEVKGRTLPIIYDIIIFPKVMEKLNIVLAHEIGHFIYERKLDINTKIIFSNLAIRHNFQVAYWPVQERNTFLSEMFANFYDSFLNDSKLLEKHPLINDFFKRNIN